VASESGLGLKIIICLKSVEGVSPVKRILFFLMK